MEIVVATGNAHKLQEISNILSPRGITILSPNDVGGIPDTIEDGDSFTANAIIKAEFGAKHCGLPVIADDSGLEVFALNGEPGIRSARYCGENASDTDKMKKVIRKLSNHDDRSARFVCVIAVATPNGVLGTVEGEVRGSILKEPIGTGGFGYDPIFMPDKYTTSFGELPAKIKDAISHRGNALMALLDSNLLNELTSFHKMS